MPALSDFSAIVALMDVQRLSEEQGVRFQQQFHERDEVIANLEHDVGFKREQIQQKAEEKQALVEEMTTVQGDTERVRQEAEQRIALLNERIRDLTSKLGIGRSDPGLSKRS